MSLRKRRKIKTTSGHKRAVEQLRQSGSYEAVCETCGINKEMVANGMQLAMCSPCIQKQVAPPKAPAPKLTAEQKALKAERKLQRVALKATDAEFKAARKAGRKPKIKQLVAPKDLGFSRGWHWKKLFKTEIGEDAQKQPVRYFTLGKEISQSQYEKLLKETANAVMAKVKPTAGFGRGWHLKKKFIAPDGTVYHKGKKVK